MKKTISIIISIAMCAMLASCGGVKNEVSDTEQPTLIDTMSLEEKVGQILFVPVSYTHLILITTPVKRCTLIILKQRG